MMTADFSRLCPARTIAHARCPGRVARVCLGRTQALKRARKALRIEHVHRATPTSISAHVSRPPSHQGCHSLAHIDSPGNRRHLVAQRVYGTLPKRVHLRRSSPCVCQFNEGAATAAAPDLGNRTSRLRSCRRHSERPFQWVRRRRWRMFQGYTTNY